jgi:3-vinyl bacteriochlorophyllide hydratase
MVQGVLAPVQFLIFGISLYLVVRSLQTGEHTDWALASVVLKTVVLYAIMVTGAIWEKVVFGRYLFAPAFYWEDVVSMGVMALHTAYVWAWWQGAWSPNDLLLLALAAYGSYAINAAQYIRKLRMARLQKTDNCPTRVHRPAHEHRHPDPHRNIRANLRLHRSRAFG